MIMKLSHEEIDNFLPKQFPLKYTVEGRGIEGKSKGKSFHLQQIRRLAGTYSVCSCMEGVRMLVCYANS